MTADGVQARALAELDPVDLGRYLVARPNGGHAALLDQRDAAVVAAFDGLHGQ